MATMTCRPCFLTGTMLYSSTTLDSTRSNLGLDEVDDLVPQLGPVQVDEGELVLPAQRPRHALLGDHVEVHQGFAQTRPGPPGVSQGVLDLLRGHEAHLEQDLSQSLSRLHASNLRPGTRHARHREA
jgi:hypothetical protein